MSGRGGDDHDLRIRYIRVGFHFQLLKAVDAQRNHREGQYDRDEALLQGESQETADHCSFLQYARSWVTPSVTMRSPSRSPLRIAARRSSCQKTVTATSSNSPGARST